jgi:hypothetical protein
VIAGVLGFLVFALGGGLVVVLRWALELDRKNEDYRADVANLRRNYNELLERELARRDAERGIPALAQKKLLAQIRALPETGER